MKDFFNPNQSNSPPPAGFCPSQLAEYVLATEELAWCPLARIWGAWVSKRNLIHAVSIITLCWYWRDDDTLDRNVHVTMMPRINPALKESHCTPSMLVPENQMFCIFLESPLFHLDANMNLPMKHLYAYRMELSVLGHVSHCM